MPFKVERRDRQWAVVNADSGRVLGSHETKQKALDQLYAVKHSYKKKRKKRKQENKARQGGSGRG